MSDDGGILEIAVDFERLDAMAAPAFREALTERLASRPDRVLLDLSNVRFVDSTGLGVLVALLKMMGPGGRVAVSGAAASVRRLFEMTRLDTLFLLFEGKDEARAALG